MPLCISDLGHSQFSLPTHPLYITTEPTPLTRLIAVDPSYMHMLRHTTHDTPFDQYRFTLPHTPRRFRHAVHPISLALTYTHADLPDNTPHSLDYG